MPLQVLRIGSRGSTLALAQANWVRDRILACRPHMQAVICVIRTAADTRPDLPIRDAGSTGVWVREIEQALLARDVDLAVHSMKDLPTRIPQGLAIGAIPEREDAHDVLVTRQPVRALSDLRPGSVVGTGSLRRRAQILAARPDLQVRDIRGNVDTRLHKLERGDCDALVLAAAGLRRLGLEDRAALRLEFEEMLPAPGQGALALETRSGDLATASLLAALHHESTAAAVLAERTFLQHAGGGCNSPVAVHAQPRGDRFSITGLIAAPDGTRVVRETLAAGAGEVQEIARELAATLLARGGREILRSIGRMP